MAKGSFRELTLEGTDVRDAMEEVSRALEAAGFTIHQRGRSGDKGNLRAVWGSKTKAFLMGFVPFGRYLKAGKRLGAEVEITKGEGGAKVRILVVPYMELFDRPEIFLVSQDFLEKLTDDSFSREKLMEVLLHLER
jgi:hypothetical protein